MYYFNLMNCGGGGGNVYDLQCLMLLNGYSNCEKEKEWQLQQTITKYQEEQYYQYQQTMMLRVQEQYNKMMEMMEKKAKSQPVTLPSVCTACSCTREYDPQVNKCKSIN